MKKLFTICLLIIISLMAKAQTEELNKEQTIAYINKIYSSDGGIRIKDDCPMILIWKVRKNSLSISNEQCKELSLDIDATTFWSIPAYANPIVRIIYYTSERHKDKQVYRIECDGNRLFDEINYSNSANLIKDALEHLFKLFNDEVK